MTAKASSEWNQAMVDEIDALKRNKTWVLIPRTTRHNVLNCKWVYRIKQDEQGNTIRHKAQLVANGMCQIDNIDVQEIFALVIKPSTICIVLSIAVSNGWSLCQLNVSNAILHGVL